MEIRLSTLKILKPFLLELLLLLLAMGWPAEAPPGVEAVGETKILLLLEELAELDKSMDFLE